MVCARDRTLVVEGQGEDLVLIVFQLLRCADNGQTVVFAVRIGGPCRAAQGDVLILVQSADEAVQLHLRQRHGFGRVTHVVIADGGKRAALLIVETAKAGGHIVARYITDQLTDAELILDLSVCHDACIVGIEYAEFVGVGTAGPHRANETASVGYIFATAALAVSRCNRSDIVAIFDNTFIRTGKAADRGVARDRAVVTAAGHHAVLFILRVPKCRELCRNTANCSTSGTDSTVVVAACSICLLYTSSPPAIILSDSCSM